MRRNSTIPLDFCGKTILITGGTRGIGLETALSFAQYGAQCLLTYNWGDHDEVAIRTKFDDVHGPSPYFYQADVANPTDTAALMSAIQTQHTQIDIFISNASSAAVVRSVEDYTLRALKKSLSYSAWPTAGYIQAIEKTFGRPPGYVIAVSSTGPDHYSYGYDFVAASKAAMECMVRYLSHRYLEKNMIINTVRSRAVKTDSFSHTFGQDIQHFVKDKIPENYWIAPQEIADAIVALCSGYCDAIRGQIINVDRGTRFFDNVMDMYARSHA